MSNLGFFLLTCVELYFKHCGRQKNGGAVTETPTITTPSIEKIADALSKAQGEFPVIPKDSEVEVYSKDTPRRLLYKYKYADLTAIISATRPALSKNGLSFTQDFVKKEIGTGLVTILMHSSGQRIETGFIPMTVDPKQDKKTVVGDFTYIKRVSLTAALGVSADEDMDAAGADAQKGQSTEKKTTGKAPAKQKVEDAADYVMPFGDMSKGKPLKSLNEETLKNIREFCKNKMAEQPAPKDINVYKTVHGKIVEFLKSMGVET